MTDDIFECVDPNGVPFSKTKNFVDKKWAMKKIAALEEENARLRELLKPFVDVGDEDARWWAVPSAYLRAVRAAIREGGKDE